MLVLIENVLIRIFDLDASVNHCASRGSDFISKRLSMKVRGQNPAQSLRPDAREKVIAAWRDLGEPAVGAAVLRKIQEGLKHSIGGGAGVSPAAIARILADADAELLHPEVIECDAEWRASEIERETKTFQHSGIRSLEFT